MNNEVVGVNEAGIDALILEINECLEKINIHYHNIYDLVEKSTQYFDCDCGKKFRDYFTKLDANYDIIKNNILSYTNDLINVKTKYKSFVENQVATINQKSIDNEI